MSKHRNPLQKTLCPVVIRPYLCRSDGLADLEDVLQREVAVLADEAVGVLGAVLGTMARGKLQRGT